MTAEGIIRELMEIYLAGNGKLSLKDARKRAEEKFEQSKVYYKKCGYLTEAKK